MLARYLFASLAVAGLIAPAVAGPPHPTPPSTPNEQVKIEVKFISIAEDSFERIGVNFTSEGVKKLSADPQIDLGKVALLNAKQAEKLLQDVEGDVRSNIMHAASMIVSDGKVSHSRCTDQHRFVTGMKAIRQGDHVVLCPKNETISTGLELSVQPEIHADRRTITVHLKSTLSSLDPNVLLFPIVVPVAASTEKGATGPSAPLTQFIQQPQINTLAMQEELIIPKGNTALLGGWKRLTEDRHEYGPPAPISKIPYLNRLFKHVGYSRSKETILVMVTATIVHKEP